MGFVNEPVEIKCFLEVINLSRNINFRTVSFAFELLNLIAFHNEFETCPLSSESTRELLIWRYETSQLIHQSRASRERQLHHRVRSSWFISLLDILEDFFQQY